MAFSYAGSIAQSRSEEINRSIMTFCRVELFVADDHSIVIHNLSLLTSARLPSPRSHILVRTSSVPAAKVEMGPFTDTSATVRNVTIPLGGIPHSAYAGFAPLPEGGVLLHAGVQLQLLQQPRKKLHSRNRKIRQYMMKTVTKLMLQKQQKTEILYMTKMETRLIRARLQQKQLQKTVEAVM